MTQLSNAFETNQPGLTKQVKKLQDLGLLGSRADEADARVRWLKVTPKGVRRRDHLVGRLEPDRRQIFKGWKKSDIGELHQHLERMKTWLDDHRDSVAGADG